MQFQVEDHTMAHLSHNSRKKARKKRDGSALLRQLQTTQQGLYNAHVTLLCILAQHGGSITCTKGTLDQVVEGVTAHTLNWRTRQGQTPNEFMIETTDTTRGDQDGEQTSQNEGQQAATRQGDRVTLTRLPDEAEGEGEAVATSAADTEAVADRFQSVAGGTGADLEADLASEQRVGDATV